MSCCRPIHVDSVRNLYGELVPVPCRHCLSCRVDNIKSWEYRCKYEYISKPSAFVTLTYDDYHLRFQNEGTLRATFSKLPDSTGVGFCDFALRSGFSPTLDRAEFTSYIDSVRHKIKRLPDGFCHSNRIDKDFKYIACGEYGDQFGRPHYHVIFFGLDFSVCARFFKSSWIAGKVKVLPVLAGGIRYVLKYFEKNQSKEFDDKNYFDYGLEPPFMSFSKGLGAGWFEANKESIAKYGMIKSGARWLPVPSYFARKYYRYNDDLLYNRYKYLDKSKEDLKLRSEHMGYSDFNTYVRDQARLKEEILINKLRNNMQPAYDYRPPLLDEMNRINYKELATNALYGDDDFEYMRPELLANYETAPF